MNSKLLKNIIESSLLASGRPLSLSELRDLFPYRERPELKAIREAIETLQAEFEDRGIELIEVATGFRIQVRPSMIDWLTKLWEERPPRYSRALMETLALIAYQQPITRGDIEEVRGVAVSTNIMRTMLERGWVKVVGHREVPGRPALYGTTPVFLEYFGLKKLDDLPPLADISDVDSVVPQLEFEMNDEDQSPLRVVVDQGKPVEADETADNEADFDDDDDDEIEAEMDDFFEDDGEDDDDEEEPEIADQKTSAVD